MSVYPGIEARERADGTRCYRATIYDKRTHQRKRATFDRLADAKRWKADAQRQIQAGVRLVDRGPTLTGAAQEWIALARRGLVRNRSGQRYKPAAVRGYEQALRLRVLPEFGSWRLRELRTVDVAQWVERMAADGLAPSTIDTTLNPLRRIYVRAVTLGLAEHNPTTGVEHPAIERRPKWIPDVALCLDLLDALPQPDRAPWATAMFAGLRRGEMVGLHSEDVDLAAGIIHVRRGWDAIAGEVAPKSTHGARSVPIVALLRDELAEHRARHPDLRPAGPLLGTLGHLVAVYDRSRARWADLGMRTVTYHDCRHAAASFFIAAGGNAKAISSILGHASIATTFDIYGHLLAGAEDELCRLADGFLSAAAHKRAAHELERLTP
jgi:integrase